MGSDPHGRRHASPAWLKAGREAAGSGATRGRKLVVQMVETFREHMAPVFVDRLDAWALQESMGAELPPIMIYGDDVSHIVSEEGITNLLLCRGPEEREQAIQELLCLNSTLAHLAECVDLARRLGHASISLVTEQAVSGGFLAFGLMVDRTYALADAQVRVMDLKAMARVTKIAHERLVELAGNSPIFAPGPENYLRMGAIQAIWEAPSASLLEAALRELSAAAAPDDQRMVIGLQRGGRRLAANVAAAVLAAG